MDIRDSTPGNVFPEAKGDKSPVFNVLETIDRWTIGERPISSNPMRSGSARPPFEKQSEHSDGNKTVASVSELKHYKIVRPWETQSSNVKETHNTAVFGKYAELVPDVQKEKKITKILEVTPADMVADHSTPTSECSKPETNITFNASTSTQHRGILEIQGQDNILKIRKSFHYNYKEVSKIKSTQRKKNNPEKIIMYECNKCSYKVTEMSNLNKHMETHSDIKPIARTGCDYRTDIISNRATLTRAHTNEKPHACKECNYSSAQKRDLNRHMRIHTKEKPYACKECNFSAAHKCNLKTHMRIHTKEKPYSCKECNYSGADKSNLITHMRIHTKEKPYSCNECNYSAAQKSNLITHRRIHTKEKPYSCKECNYSGARKSHLNTHMRTHTK